MARPKMTSLCHKLSDWEVIEAYCSWRNGIRLETLAMRYGISAKTFERAFKRLRERGLAA